MSRGASPRLAVALGVVFADYSVWGGRRGGGRRDRDADERPGADGKLRPVEHPASASPAPLGGSIGSTTIQWDIDPRDETLDALPEEVGGLRKRGYQLVTLTQMLGYKLVYR